MADGGFDDKPVGTCVQNCPCSSITGVEIVSIDFVSEHGVLTDHEADWKAGGSKYTGPAYRTGAGGKAHRHPISHTMSKPMEIVVVLDVEPADACSEQVRLSATATPAGIEFAKEIRVGGGRHTVRMKSDRAFQSVVQRMDLRLSWHCHVWFDPKRGTSSRAVPVSPSGTGTELFVTMDTPKAKSANDLTVWRMRRAVKEVAATDYQKDAIAWRAPVYIVSGLVKRWGSYNLDVSHPSDEWRLALEKKNEHGHLIGADCITIATYIGSVIQMVGCPGKADALVVWAKVPTPDKAEVTTDPSLRPNTQDPEQLHDLFYEPGTGEDTSAWTAALVDHNGQANRFEGCLRFRYQGKTRLFMGGAPRKPFEEPQDPPLAGHRSAADEVLHIFKWLAFYDYNRTFKYKKVAGRKVIDWKYETAVWFYADATWGSGGPPTKKPNLWKKTP